MKIGKGVMSEQLFILMNLMQMLTKEYKGMLTKEKNIFVQTKLMEMKYNLYLGNSKRIKVQ